MTMGQLGIAYLAVGAILASVLCIANRIRAVDTALVFVLWPIWVPLTLSQAPASPVIDDVGARLRYVTAQLAELEHQRRVYRDELEALQQMLAEYRPQSGR